MAAAELKTLGRYNIERVLGKGAMGVVYEGVDPRLGRRVAIKTILKSHLDDDTAKDFAMRFVREAQAVARLNHPNIVQVYDFGEEGDIAYIVMEFIKGKELKTFFDANERFDLKEAVRIMCELLDALEFAHHAGIIHRDIKPANVMLDSASRTKLTDFGVARVQDTDKTAVERTQAGTMVGTPAYMSPEQITGGNIDRRADVFSAGIILYQFLTGEKPFTGGGAWTIAKKIIQEDPPLPSSINTNVTPLFDAVVNKALAKTADARYQSAKDFAVALRRALDGKAAEDDADETIAGTIIAPAGPPPRPAPKAELTRSGSSGTAGNQEIELEFWRAIKDGNDPDDFDLYVQQFPNGIYAALARRKITKLRGAEQSKAGDDSGLLAKRDLEERREAEEAAEAERREAAAMAKLADQKAKHEADIVKREAEMAKREAEARAKLEAEEVTRRHAVEKARQEAEAALAKREAETKAKIAAEEKARREAAEKQRAEAEAAMAKREAESKAKFEAELAKRDAEAKARREAEEKARREAEARTKAEVEARAKAEAEARAKREALEAKARTEAEARAKREAEERAKREAEFAKREAELKKLEEDAKSRGDETIVAAPPARKGPMLAIIIGLLIAVAGGGTWLAMRPEAQNEELKKALEQAKQREAEFQQAKQREAQLMKEVELAKQREVEAKKSGDIKQQQALAEQTRLREAEAQKQAELTRQREADSKKQAESAKQQSEQGKQVDAKKQAETAKLAAEKNAAERAAAEKAQAAKLAQDKAANEQKTAADKALADKLAEAERRAAAAEQKAAAAAAEAEKRAAEKAAQDKLALAAPAAPAPGSPVETLLAQAAAKESEGANKDAVRLYTQAARAGSGKAAKRLGDIYTKGVDGVPRDYAESLKWYNAARVLGETVDELKQRR
jgi:serine/threonine-protein kinase